MKWEAVNPSLIDQLQSLAQSNPVEACVAMVGVLAAVTYKLT